MIMTIMVIGELKQIDLPNTIIFTVKICAICFSIEGRHDIRHHVRYQLEDMQDI